MTFSSTANDLTTKDRLKSWLDIASSDTGNDTALGVLVSAASNYFLQLINRPSLYTQTYTEIRDGQGSTRMMLKNYPVTAVSAVTIDTVSVPVGTVNPFVAGFISDDKSVMLLGYQFTRGYANVSVTYTAGYPVMGGSPTAPQDLTMLGVEQAVLALAAAWWKRKEHVDQLSQSVGGVQTFTFNPKDVPPETATMVRQLASVAPIGL